jgi:hypothetical protein
MSELYRTVHCCSALHFYVDPDFYKTIDATPALLDTDTGHRWQTIIF